MSNTVCFGFCDIQKKLRIFTKLFIKIKFGKKKEESTVNEIGERDIKF